MFTKSYARWTGFPGIVVTEETEGRNRTGRPSAVTPIRVTVISRSSMDPVVLEIAGSPSLAVPTPVESAHALSPAFPAPPIPNRAQNILKSGTFA